MLLKALVVGGDLLDSQLQPPINPNPNPKPYTDLKNLVETLYEAKRMFHSLNVGTGNSTGTLVSCELGLGVYCMATWSYSDHIFEFRTSIYGHRNCCMQGVSGDALAKYSTPIVPISILISPSKEKLAPELLNPKP